MQLRRRGGRRRWRRTCRPATWWSASRPCRSAPPPGWPTLVAEVTPGAVLAWNPEFLREGYAVQDTLHPDRLVYGLPAGADGELARRLLDEVYASRAGRRHPAGGHRLPDRGAGQGGGERVPGHQDLLHQRDGRGLRGQRRRRHQTRRRDRPRRPDRPASSSTPGSGSAAAACPRTSARSWPGPASWAPATRSASCRRSTQINMRRRVRMVDLAREVCGGSIIGRRIAVLGRGVQARTATTSATRRR